MLRSILPLLAIAALATAMPAAAQPKRVASLNLCADQLLLALAPERIASLSPLARDPRMSFLAEKAAAHSANPGRGEAMILDRPDLVLAGAYDGRARRDLLARYAVPMQVVLPWASLADGRRHIRELARTLGAPERGEALVAEIDGALAASKNIAPGPRTILPLQRRGYTPGEASLVAELLRHMGLVPYQQALGMPEGGFVRLEQLVANPPDYLLLSREEVLAFDHGSALLIHPALARTVPPERRLVIGGPLLTCEGPSTPAAIRALAAEIAAKVR